MVYSCDIFMLYFIFQALTVRLSMTGMCLELLKVLIKILEDRVNWLAKFKSKSNV